MMDWEFECSHTEMPICPHCGHENENIERYDNFSMYRCKCPQCSKTYFVEKELSFYTSPIEER
jgi:transposase-like protein